MYHLSISSVMFIHLWFTTSPMELFNNLWHEKVEIYVHARIYWALIVICTLYSDIEEKYSVNLYLTLPFLDPTLLYSSYYWWVCYLWPSIHGIWDYLSLDCKYLLVDLVDANYMAFYSRDGRKAGLSTALCLNF